MAQQNVEIVREAWDAYSRGDYDRVAGFHDAHIVVVTLEDGVVYGNDAVLANYKRWNEAWESAETTLEEVIGHGDRVFLTVDSTAVVERAGSKSKAASMSSTRCATARFCA